MLNCKKKRERTRKLHCSISVLLPIFVLFHGGDEQQAVSRNSFLTVIQLLLYCTDILL